MFTVDDLKLMPQFANMYREALEYGDEAVAAKILQYAARAWFGSMYWDNYHNALDCLMPLRNAHSSADIFGEDGLPF